MIVRDCLGGPLRLQVVAADVRRMVPKSGELAKRCEESGEAVNLFFSIVSPEVGGEIRTTNSLPS